MDRYIIRCWIPAEVDEEKIYEGIEKAREAVDHYRTLQPENIYKIEKVAKRTEESGLESRF